MTCELFSLPEPIEIATVALLVGNLFYVSYLEQPGEPIPFTFCDLPFIGERSPGDGGDEE